MEGISLYIKMENCSVTFQGSSRVQALKNISFSFNKNDWITFLGPSGSGKTTLLNAIGGVLSLTEGRIVVDGKEIGAFNHEELQEYRRTKTGFIYQDYKLLEPFNVLENVMLPQWPYQKRNILEQKAKEVIEDLNMSHRMYAYPAQLSGGEKQRTAIARAMLNQPDILLCDEPTGNLDEENRENILQILTELHQKGMTILLVTHDLEVAKWGTREITLRDGKIMEPVTKV